MKLGGPQLDKTVDRVVAMYAQRRQRLIAALEEGGYPYGGRKLTASEQISRFIEMVPEDYQSLVIKLNDKYRGLPNAYDLVNKDLAAFISRMITLMSAKGQISDTQFNQQAQQIYTDIGGA